MFTGGSLVAVRRNWLDGILGKFALHERVRCVLKLATAAALVAAAYLGSSEMARRYSTRYLKAAALSESSNVAYAATQCAKAVALDPNNGRAHYELGFIDEKLGRGDDAIREYRTAQDMDPSLLEAYSDLAHALILYKKDYVGAIKVLDNGLRNSGLIWKLNKSTFAAVQRNYGWAMIQMGYAQAAVEHLQASRDAVPHQIGAYCLLGQALEQLKDPGAKAAFLKCKEGNDCRKQHPELWEDKPEPDWILEAEKHVPH